MSNVHSLFPALPMDYSHRDDYDPPDANWLEHHTLGCPYQIEIDLNRAGHTRWRDPGTSGPWTEGEPPQGWANWHEGNVS